MTGGVFRPLYRIHLGNINPGEKVFLDSNIWCQTFNMFSITSVKAVKKSGEEYDMPLDEFRVMHDFQVRLSGENTEMKTRNLYLTTGVEGQFKKTKKPYYTYQKGAIAYHKRGT